MNSHQRRAALRAAAAREHVTATPSPGGGWTARHLGLSLGDGLPSRTAALAWGLTWGRWATGVPIVLTLHIPPRGTP